MRLARVSDFEALRRLWRELDQQHADIHPRFFAPPAPGGHRNATELQRAIGDPQRHLFVAELAGVLVGAVHVRLYETPRDPMIQRALRGHVEDLIVAGEARRAGAGRALMEAAAQWARRCGAEQLLLTVWSGNEQAAKFYDALGYATINRVLSLDL